MVEPGSDAAEGSPDADRHGETDESTPESSNGDDRSGSVSGATPEAASGTPDRREPADLRAAVEERYDFDAFGPADMDRMTAEEWEAAFDPETWITGTALLDRVEADLKDRVRRRNIFALVERIEEDGEERILAYSDVGYVVVHPDGTVRGEGSIVREVEPVVALCSMEEYDPGPLPDADEPLLPDPDEISAGSGALGNSIMLVVATVQVLAGLFLLLAPVVVDPLIRTLCTPGPGPRGYICSVGPVDATLFLSGRSVVLTTTVGLGFLVIGGIILLLVANARLSDRFRAQEYRDRLRAAGVGTDDRPSFLPIVDADEDGDDPSPAAEDDDDPSPAAEDDGDREAEGSGASNRSTSPEESGGSRAADEPTDTGRSDTDSLGQ